MCKFLDIGFDNYVNINKIGKITQYSSAPARRIIKDAKYNELINCTAGRKTLSIIFTKDNKIILSAVSKEILIEKYKSIVKK
ncbi:MAG: DUF370 domain-containing protein [Clostridium sp.]|uniref:DUF370 domain-containing protein n=1 Tax=Clostridium sp. TaxID=1506 RepID=UPI0039E93CEC